MPTLRPAVSLLAIPCLWLSGCGGEPAAFGAEQRYTARERPIEWSADDAARLHLGPAPAPAPAATAFTAPTPAGWTLLPPEPAKFKDLVYAVAGAPDATCHLTAAVGGGLEGNVARWYEQMGQALPAGGVAALPAAELMGKRGVLVEIEGAFAGKDGMKLLGLITAEGQQCTTLKLVASKAIADAERERFLELGRSLRAAAAPAPAAATAAATEPRPAGKAAFAAYTVPAGWKEVKSTSSMRLFTFQIGEQTELSVIQLGGAGGGLRPNLDRWRQQMGQEPLDDAAFAALPRVDVFGQKAPLLELRGKFADGMTNRAFDDAAFLGVVAEQPDAAFFFKLTGPHAEAQAHRQELLDFLASLRR